VAEEVRELNVAGNRESTTPGIGERVEQPAGRLDELLPDVWFASHPAARRKTAA
jgi:hypothetical protein